MTRPFSPFAGQTYVLNSTIGSTDTTITLQSFTVPVTGVPVTMALLNTTIVFGTLAPKTSTKEFISFTGITQNANGTATLTGVTRGLAFVYPFTSNSIYQLPHAGQSNFILSNPPQLYEEYMSLSDDNTATGLNIFSQAPQAEVDPVLPDDLTRLSYVQTLVLGTLTTIDVIVPGTAGASVVAGNIVYLDTGTNTWKLTDATNPATVNDVLLGVSQGTATSSNPIPGGILLQGVDTHQSGLTGGQVQYASNTPGAMSTTPGTVTVALGIAKSATNLYFVPRFDQQVTQAQLNAMVGDNTDIAVGTGNKFVTQTGFIHNTEKYAVDTGTTDTYAVALSPVITSLTDGMVVYAKIVHANATTTPTLNLNALGAKTIVKGSGIALVAGDIAANQFCTFIYDLTNTQWVLQNPTATAVSNIFTNGFQTYTATTASSTLTFAHGLGKIPRKTKFSAVLAQATAATQISQSIGVYNRTTNSNVAYATKAGTAFTSAASSDSTYCIYIYDITQGSYQRATCTVDATNINLAFVYAATLAGTIQIMWEAE